MPPRPPKQLQNIGFDEKPYDPGQDQEKVRRHLTYGVLGVFSVVLIVYVLIGIYLDDSHWVRMKDVLGVVFPTVTGLVGTVMGFYFGSKKH